VFHEKPENIAALATPEAVENLPVRIHMKGWCFFFVEWTQGFERATAAMERQVGPDQVDNIIPEPDFFNYSLGDDF
jgi:hypothetical protein